MGTSARDVLRAVKATRPGALAARGIPGSAGAPSSPQGAGNGYMGNFSPMAGTLATGDGSWTNAYRSYLPRPPRDFTDGAFGPFSPILPTPVDAPEPDSDFADPRLWQYDVGWNLPTGQPGSEGIKLCDFNTLRTLADLYSVARACIQLRKAEIRGLTWDITPTKDAAKAMRGSPQQAKDFGKRRGEAMKFLSHPDPDFFSWGTFLDALLEEVFVFDALSLLFRSKWGKGQGKGLLGSDLDSLSLINGPTIRPLVGMHGERPRPPAPAYQQYLYGVPRCDLWTVMTARDVEMGSLEGAEYNKFRVDQLLYLPMVPKRWTPYGFPPIERALVPVMSGLQKQGYQLDFFREGTVPAVYISPGGVNADLTPNQIRELQDALNAVAGDPAWKHKIIVLPADSKVMPQKPAEIADQFDEIVMNQVCMAFDVQPMELGISPKVSTTQSSGAANQMAKQSSSTHQRKATKPLLKYLSDIFNYLLRDVCQQDDMQFIFEGLEEDEDEETQTSLLVQQIGAGLASIDEGREALGKQPWGLPETSDPGWATATGFTPLGQQPMTGLPIPGQPGQPPTPGAPGQAATPGHAAAQGVAAAQGKPAQPSAQPAKPTTAPAKPTAKAAQPQDAEPPSDAAREAVVAAAVTGVLARLRDLVRSYHGDRTSAAVALQGAVEAMARGYGSVMGAASKHAVEEHGGVVQDFTGGAASRAETQRAFLMGMLKAAAEDDSDDPGWLDSRAALYGRTMGAAYNEAFGQTVQANHPDYEIIWRLGETEHCPLCLAREGKSYTFDTLPGYPGDGGFGGADALCLGGPNCGCRLEYKEEGKESLFADNTQRPESVQYYQDQLALIQGNRARAAQERTDFVDSLPTTGAQARALNRDQIRQLLADEANAAIRASGGYPGVSVEPADIPADLVVAHPAWMKSRAADAELEALARHVRKGRLISSWVPKHIDNPLLARIAEHMAKGLDVDTAIDVARRTRRVDPNGQEYWTDGEESWSSPAGGGGNILTPHDADGIQGKTATLSKEQVNYRPAASLTRRCGTCSMFVVHGDDETSECTLVKGLISTDHVCDRWEGRSNKGASDPSDPNPVDAEHVMNQMRRNYPEKAIGWMRDARWIGPVSVPLDRVDFDDRDSWAADHDKSRVRHFAKRIKKGDARLHPVVAVQEPGDDKIRVIDGHHRTLAYEKLGQPVKAYVGFVDSDGGPWDETHTMQIHSGDDPDNKGVSPSEKGADTPSKEGDAERLREYWTRGEGAAKIRWGEPGDFDRCVMHVGKYMANPEGYCNERHHDALGFYPATHAAMERGHKSARGYEVDSRSGMVSLDIPPGVIPPHPGGVTDHHITVVYLGKGLTDEQWDAALSRARVAAARISDPIAAMVGGVDSFPASDGSDGKIPAFAPVVAPGAQGLRDELADLSASERKGWHPHVTLAYLEEGDPMPEPVPPTPVEFTHLSVHLGDHVERIAFGGSGGPAGS